MHAFKRCLFYNTCMVEKFEAVVSKQGERHMINVPVRKRKKFALGTEVEVRKTRGGN